MNRLFPLAAGLVAATLGACNCNTPPPPGGDVCGTGTVDGSPHAIDPAATRTVLVVKRKDGAGCGVFHNHVVSAKNALLEYTLDNADLANSTVKVTVLAAGLEPDDADLRAELLPDGENEPLSDGDRQSIRGSVAEEVLANEHPNLVFTLTGFSTSSGEGTAKMTADLAGGSSEVDVAYTVTKEGDTLKVTGTATLDGAPYGIPRNSLGFCVEPEMDVVFDLALVPAAAAVVCEGAVPPPPFEPTFFDDPECADEVGYNEVRDVAVRRCAGCHAGDLRLGATVPLIEWADWRIDSVRNPGRPLYETARDYAHLSPEDGLSMPPVDPIEPLASPLTPEELALFDAWVAGGARDAECANDPPKTLFEDVDVAAVECDDAIHYSSPGPDGATAQEFMENNCTYCHLDLTGAYSQVPQVAQLDGAGLPIPDDATGLAALDHALANGPVAHPFYLGDAEAPLSFWEASVIRAEDGSMPPNLPAGTYDGDPAFEQFKAWVAAGAPAGPCN